MISIRPLYALFAAALVSIPIARADGLTPPTQNPPRAPENPIAAISLNQLAATRERPLFAPDRRRPNAALIISHAKPPAPDPPRLSLSGVVVDKNGPTAVVRSDPGGKARRVRLGDDVGGWRVTQIDRQQLVISLDDRSAAVRMFKSDHSSKQIAAVRPLGRMLEVNAENLPKPHHGD